VKRDRGTYRPGIEAAEMNPTVETVATSGCRRCRNMRKQNGASISRDALWTPRGLRPCAMHVSTLSGNREILCLSGEEKTQTGIGKF